MGDENPPLTLGDYSRPSHEGYRNTIELSEGNNVVPLRSDTIQLVQNGCAFHELRSEDPNQHLKDFLKLVDSFDLNVKIRKGRDYVYFNFPFAIKLAIGLNVNLRDPSPLGRISLRVSLLRVIPINLKGNMWELEDLIDKKIDWNMPPKEGDGVWHIRIEIINPDGENFDRTFQSIPTTRKLYEKEKPSDIIDLEHFHDS
ncbi:hypothetical protein Tco_1244176 [Tanacetum coccineum]